MEEPDDRFKETYTFTVDDAVFTIDVAPVSISLPPFPFCPRLLVDVQATVNALLPWCVHVPFANDIVRAVPVKFTIADVVSCASQNVSDDMERNT